MLLKFLFVFSLCTLASSVGLDKKDMLFLSESTAKALKGCERIRGATLFGEPSFTNQTAESVDKSFFIQKIKQQLKKHMGTRFGGTDSSKEKITMAALLSGQSQENGKTTEMNYELKLSFTTPQDVICETQNSLSKTYTRN